MNRGKGMNWMQRAVARRHQQESGMTLIELMIVILILGILSAIVVLGIGAFQDTGTEVSCKTTAASIESAMAASYAKSDPPTYANWADYTKNGAESVSKFGITVDTGTGTATCPATP